MANRRVAVRAVDADGGTWVLVGGGATPFDAGVSAKSVSIPRPHCIARTTGGDLLVSLWDPSRVFRYVLASDTVAAVAGTGTQASATDGLPAVSNPLFYPCVGASPSDAVFIAEQWGRTIRTINDAGAYVKVAGTGWYVSNFYGDNEPATAAGLFYPGSAAFDPFSAALYIADTNNQRIRRVSADSGITTVAGTGTASYTGDFVPALDAGFRTPWGIALDLAGNVIIGDSDNQRMRLLSPAFGFVNLLAGTGTAGYSGEGTTATSAMLNSPRGPIVASNGDIYVADRNNHVVRSGASPRVAS